MLERKEIVLLLIFHRKWHGILLIRNTYLELFLYVFLLCSKRLDDEKTFTRRTNFLQGWVHIIFSNSRITKYIVPAVVTKGNDEYHGDGDGCFSQLCCCSVDHSEIKENSRKHDFPLGFQWIHACHTLQVKTVSQCEKCLLEEIGIHSIN